MPQEWAKTGIQFAVTISTAGPLDPPGAGQTFNLTDWAGENYVKGEPGISIRRGRSDEFQQFDAGTCTFTLKNNNREFDPARAMVALDAPGSAGSGASTPDVAALAPNGDLYVRVKLSMANWVPGGFGQFIIGQWPGGGQDSWVFNITAAGNPRLDFTTDGSTGLSATSTAGTGFAAGSVHWIDVLLDVNNGSGGRTATFRTSEDGFTWSELGTPVTTAGTVTLFNSTSSLIAGGGALPLDGQIYQADVRWGGLTGSLVASPDFSAQSPGTTSFTDEVGRVWSMIGTGSIRYDDNASPFAPILKPRRRVTIVTGDSDDLSSLTVLFVGYLEGWPQTWPDKTVGTVDIVAHDLLSVLSQTQTEEASGVLVLDSIFQGQLDEEILAGDLPQQFTGERIRSLTQLAGVSSQQVSLDTGLTQVMALQPSGEILGLCQEAEIAEAGFFFVDREGIVTFLDRHSRFQHPRLSEVQATLTDQQYTGMAVDFSTTQMWNYARFTRPPLDDFDLPHEAIEVDDVSVHENGRRQYAKTIPVISDGETLGRAQFWIQRYAWPKRRPSPVTIRPRKNLPALFLNVARRDLLDRITLERTPLGIGPTDRFTGLIELLEHRITKTDWVCTIGISLIDIDDGANCLMLDDADLGQLDQEVLCY